MAFPFLAKINPLRGAIDRGVQKALSGIFAGQGWLPLFRETYTGAWQRGHRPIAYDLVMSSPTVFRCLTQISGDVAKMGVCLQLQDSDGIWNNVQNPAYAILNTDPNGFQNWIQFVETLMRSLLERGNAYLLKARDNRNVVTDLYILNPNRIRPLVAEETGDVFYQIQPDYLNGIKASMTIPARELIHIRINANHHPLIGESPLYAAGLPAKVSLDILQDSKSFYENSSQPGGVLTAPGTVQPSTAERLKEHFEQNFTGNQNRGRVAVLGDGLKFESLAMSAVDAQLVEQLKVYDLQVCNAFAMSPYKLGLVNLPPGLTINAVNTDYFTSCLQTYVEHIELALTRGLGLAANLRVKMDEDKLLRMDTAALATMLGDIVKAGILAPNEGRKRLNYKPVAGGDMPYMQQQNYSLEALAKRDASDDPFETVRETLTGPAPANVPQPAGVAGDASATSAPAPVPEPTPEEAAKALEKILSEMALLRFARKFEAAIPYDSLRKAA